MTEIKKKKEEVIEEEPKTTYIARAVPIEDMFNHINEKLDIAMVQLQELTKLAKEE